MTHRKHGQAGAGVFVAPVAGQRPEVGRRPQEDDEEQGQGRQADAVGHRGPAEHRRHRPGGATDDDVHGRGRLQDDGVDDGVAQEGGQREPHGERVDRHVQQPQPGAAGEAGEAQRLGGADQAEGQRAGPGAGHAGVDRAFDQAVDRRRGAGHQRDADGGGQHQAGGRPAGLGEEHADHRGEHDQAVHPRLALGDEGGQAQAEGRAQGGGAEGRRHRGLRASLRDVSRPRRNGAGVPCL